MPVLSMNMSECPGNTTYVKPAGYFGILINITRIIIINEVVPERLTKDDPCKDYETGANAGSYPAVAWFMQGA
jgi:hypothetical protein